MIGKPDIVRQITITLSRTETTLDLSQKAEKGMLMTGGGQDYGTICNLGVRAPVMDRESSRLTDTLNRRTLYYMIQ